jgi:hypothetical protein
MHSIATTIKNKIAKAMIRSSRKNPVLESNGKAETITNFSELACKLHR